MGGRWMGFCKARRIQPRGDSVLTELDVSPGLGCARQHGMDATPPPPHPEGSSFALHTSGALKYFPHAFAASKIVHIFLKEDIKQTNGSAMLVTASKGFSLAIMKSKG